MKLAEGEMMMSFNDYINHESTVLIYRELNEIEKNEVNITIQESGQHLGDETLLNNGYMRKPAKGLKDKEGKAVKVIVNKENEEIIVYDYFKIVRIEKRPKKGTRRAVN